MGRKFEPTPSSPRPPVEFAKKINDKKVGFPAYTHPVPFTALSLHQKPESTATEKIDQN